MKEEIIISGFGGQGVLSLGKILAYSALLQGQEVSWMPSYGPEMRGGTSNVTVILSDKRISSPVLNVYDTAIVLNQPSMDKFAPRVKPGGTLIYDSGTVKTIPDRKDINIYKINAAEYASARDMTKTFNMIVLGGLLKIRPLTTVESVVESLKKSLPERHHHLLPMNETALKAGMELIEKV